MLTSFRAPVRSPKPVAASQQPWAGTHQWEKILSRPIKALVAYRVDELIIKTRFQLWWSIFWNVSNWRNKYRSSCLWTTCHTHIFSSTSLLNFLPHSPASSLQLFPLLGLSETTETGEKGEKGVHRYDLHDCIVSCHRKTSSLPTPSTTCPPAKNNINIYYLCRCRFFKSANKPLQTGLNGIKCPM